LETNHQKEGYNKNYSYGGEDGVGVGVVGAAMKLSMSSSKEVEVVRSVGECDGAAKVVGAKEVAASMATTVDSV